MTGGFIRLFVPLEILTGFLNRTFCSHKWKNTNHDTFCVYCGETMTPTRLHMNEAPIENPFAPGGNRYSNPNPERLHEMLCEYVGSYHVTTFAGLDRAIDSIAETYGGIYFDDPEYTHAYNVKSGPVRYISNPNNPTGAWRKINLEDEITVVDEAYIEYTDRPSMVELCKSHHNLFVLRSFSKAFAMADYRLGYVVGYRVGQLKRNPKEITGFAQRAGMKALENLEWMHAHVKNIRETREWFCGELDKRGIPYHPSETNFVLLKVRLDLPGFWTRDKLDCTRITMGTRKQMEALVKCL